MPGDDEVIGQARQQADAQGDEEAPGPCTRGHPGARIQQKILFESKLNVLLKEVSLCWTFMPFHVVLRVWGLLCSVPKAPFVSALREYEISHAHDSARQQERTHRIGNCTR